MTQIHNTNIRTSRLIDRLDDALLLIAPDLTVQELLTQAARDLGSTSTKRRELLGLPLNEVLTPVLAPRVLQQLMTQIHTLSNAPTEPLPTLRSLEGAASSALRAAGLTRWYDVWLQTFVGDDGVTLLLGLRDVSERWRLAQELEDARRAHEMTLGVLRADALALEDFLNTALQSMSTLHALQRLPARADGAFRDKLARIGNELRNLGEAALKVGLTPIVSRANALDDTLQSLQTQAVLSGDDFLQLPPALDTLFILIGTASRLTEQRAGRLVNQAVQNVPTTKLPQPWHERIAATLQGLVGTVGNDLAQPAQLSVQGLEQVPSVWQRNVEHLLVSLVRNAIEHGIEPLYQRVADNKPAVGAIVVECSTAPGQGCTLSVRDDGRGIDPSLLAHYRIDAGSIELDTASQQDTEALLGIPASHSNDELLLTQARGLGLEFTRELLLRMQGSLQVSCKPKQWTLVQLHLPETQAATASDASLAETQQVA